MNRNLLLPNKWKKWGFILLICYFAYGFAIVFEVVNENITDAIKHPVLSIDKNTYNDIMFKAIPHSIISESKVRYESLLGTINSIMLYAALLIFVFSAKKVEDELTGKIRLDAMAWAVIVNYVFLILASIGIWGGLFILIFYFSQFLTLLIMLARFSYLSHQFKKSEFKSNSIFEKINRPHRLLLPHRYRNIGWIILGVSVFLHSASLLFPFTINYWVPDFFGHFWRAMNHYPIEGNYSIWADRNILPSILLILTAVGAMFVAFSREAEEDELISQYRLNALSWALVIHYGILMLLHFVLGGFLYWFAFQYMMFTPLLIFILRFNYLKYSLRKELCYEK